MSTGWLKTARQGDARILSAGGDWTLPSLAALDPIARDAQAAAGASRARFQLHDVLRMDTGGAWLLARTTRALEAQGVAVSFEGANEAQDELLRLARPNPIS